MRAVFISGTRQARVYTAACEGGAAQSFACAPWMCTRRAVTVRPPTWARRRRQRGGGQPREGVRDAVGMAIPEAHLRARRISPAKFDRELAASASTILCLDEVEEAEGGTEARPSSHRGGDGEAARSRSLGTNLGAGLDQRLIQFYGQAREVAQFVAAAGGGGGPVHHEAAGNGREEEAPSRPVMRSCPAREPPPPPQAEAVAYVRGQGAKGADPPRDPSQGGDTVNTLTLDDGDRVPVRADRYAALRRTIHGAGSGGGRVWEELEGALDDKGSSETSAADRSGKDGKANRQRQKESTREGLLYGATRHPCLLQGAGCGASSSSSSSSRDHHPQAGVCLWRSFPAVCCVEQLQTGKCEAALAGRCPWHHGEVSRREAETLLAESLFAREGVGRAAEEAVNGRLAKGIAAVEAVLRLFVDLVVTALAAAAAAPPEGSRPASLASTRDPQVRWQLLLAALDEQQQREQREGEGEEGHADSRGGDLRWRKDATGEMTLVVDTELAMAAASSTDLEGQKAFARDDLVSGGSGEGTALYELERMWSEAEEEERMRTHVSPPPPPPPGAVGVGGPSLCEDFRCLWQSFLVVDGAELRLSPLLVDFVFASASVQLAEADGAGEEAPQGRGELLRKAAQHLLRRRLSECERFTAVQQHQRHQQEREPANAAAHTGCHSEAQRLRWAPLLLLKDLLLVERLGELVSRLPEEGMGRATGASPQRVNSTFLDAVVGAVHGGDVVGPAATAVTPHAARCSQLSRAWDALHCILLKVCEGLMQRELSRPPTRTRTRAMAMATATDRRQHPLSLLSFAQTSLIGLVLAGSQTLGALHEQQLLEHAGWQPWTDAQVFSPFQSAVYTATTYAQHHLPVLAASCEASLLNSLLLCTTSHMEERFGLAQRSPMGSALDAPPPATALTPWLSDREWRSQRALAETLRRCVPVAMAFLAALQDLSQALAGERLALQQEFLARREAYRADEEERKRGRRTRKYNSNGNETGSGSGATAEALATPLMDRMLPHGTVAVSAGATASLVRLLLEGGSPYRALRLSVSVVRMVRALRHAARQPLPQLVQTEKTVHRMSREAKTGRKRIVKVRVPMLSLVAGDGRFVGVGDRDAEAATHEASAIGLLYQVDESVVEEMTRAGLRMGPAGAKLADGVWRDCVRGHFEDYTEARCLPTPTPRDVIRYVRTDIATTAGSSGSRDGGCCADAGHDGGGGGGDRVWAAAAVRRAASPEGHVLRLRGLRAGEPRTLLPSSAANKGEPLPYPHRRVPPTALLLEILVTHTQPDDTARHQQYNRLFTSDLRSFATDEVLTARQCALCVRRPQWALQAKECVWQVAAQRLARAPLSAFGGAALLPIWRGRLACGDGGEWGELVEEWGAPPSLETLLSRGSSEESARDSGGPRQTTTEDLKRLLRGHPSSGLEGDGEDGGRPRLTAAEQRRRRQLIRSPLSLYRPEALLTHIVTATAAPDAGGVQHTQRLLRTLWSACVGALLGLSAASLGGTGHTGRLATNALSQSVVAAAQLDALHEHRREEGGLRHCAAVGDAPRVWSERTCMMLLLSRVWAPPHREKATGDTSLPLTSARTALIADAGAFLALQHRLHQAVTRGKATEGQHPDTVLPPHQAAAEQHHAATPVWSLLEPIASLPQCVVAHWLDTTLLSPSPSFMAWFVAHTDRRDAEGVAAVLEWLAMLAARGHPGAALLSSQWRPLSSPLAPSRKHLDAQAPSHAR